MTGVRALILNVAILVFNEVALCSEPVFYHHEIPYFHLSCFTLTFVCSSGCCGGKY